jgi:hypothetical protein
MSRLQWIAEDYELGISHGVFYPKNSPGEVWNGLSSVEELPETLSSRSTYLDGVKLGNLFREGPFSAKISAYSAPPSFSSGIAQHRQQNFGFSYEVEDKIHIVYNAVVGPSAMIYQFRNINLFNWTIYATPIALPEGGSSAHLIVDRTIAYPSTIAVLEDILYGSDTSDPHLPTPIEIFEIFEENSILRVIDNGDGTFTVTGPDEVIQMLDPITFEITYPTATYLDADTYTIHSL